MRILDLFETSNVQRLGDWTKDQVDVRFPFLIRLIHGKKLVSTVDSDWSVEDREAIVKSDTLDKLQAILEKLPVDIDLFVVNVPTTVAGSINRMPKSIEKEIKKKVRKNAITLVFGDLKFEDVDYEADEIITLNGKVSPWSFLHKFAHTIMSKAKLKGKYLNVPKAIEVHIFKTIKKILKQNYKYNLRKAPVDLEVNNFRDPPEAANYYNAFFTFGSARNNQLAAVGELMTETIAQYLYSGKITLKLPDEFHGHKFKGDRDKVQAHLEEECRKAEMYINKGLMAMTGNIYTGE